MMNLLYDGSVKRVRGAQGATPYWFDYSNDYSVFDWGKMPNAIPQKGDSLYRMARAFFEHFAQPESFSSPSPELQSWVDAEFLAELAESGVRSHHLPEHQEAYPSWLPVLPLEVLHPTQLGPEQWSYPRERPTAWRLLPLEVIFRFGAPAGSSLFKRLTPEYSEKLGLPADVQPGSLFERPIIEFSTKLEDKDSYISEAHAAEISLLSEQELKRVKMLSLVLAEKLQSMFDSIGVLLWDGKFEFGYRYNNGQCELMVVDSIGIDELRLSIDQFPLSKECLRQFYRGSDWKEAVDAAKQQSKTEGGSWKELVQNQYNQAPEPLPDALVQGVSDMYLQVAEGIECFCAGGSFELQRLKEITDGISEILTENQETYRTGSSK
jgi:phosphoribosylaminoimidazole-succinocarboxamide synthase